MYSRHTLREGARPETVRDNMGHANIDVTQNVYGKNCWEEREDAVTQAVEAMTNAAQNAEKEECSVRRGKQELKTPKYCMRAWPRSNTT